MHAVSSGQMDEDSVQKNLAAGDTVSPHFHLQEENLSQGGEKRNNSSSVVEIRRKKKAELFRLRLFLSKPMKPENARVP